MKFLFPIFNHCGMLTSMHLESATYTLTLSPDVLASLPESVQSHIRFLEINLQQTQIALQQLQIRVQELEAKLAKNSSNSGKPPSSDGLKRPPKSERTSSGRKPGGQEGRIGKNLVQVGDPDHVKIHTPMNCQGCGFNLSNISGSVAEARQVFDIPKPVVEVTEHQAEKKTCPCCGCVSRGVFPEDIKAPVQYGQRVQALATYFSHQHFIPVERLGQIFEDVFGIGISPGTCANIDEKLFKNLEIFEAGLKAYLIAERILHFDETGMRCEKKLQWVHIAASESAALYIIHSKRGLEAMDEMGILPQFHGSAIHDHWFPYFSYQQVTHGLCNAHHLREFTFVYEQEKEEWAKHMKTLLLKANNRVEKFRQQGFLPQEELLELEQEYTRIITEGIAYHAQLPPLPKGKRGKRKQRDGKNLLDRLVKKQACVLLFMYDFSAPFTNNLGEQGIRMVKLKQKIGGCFRTLRGGQIFCRIRSYLATARKQGWDIWDALADAIRGTPWLLSSPAHAQTIPA